MLLKLCAIFAAGIVMDILMARYTRAVAEKRPMFAACFSSVITIVNLTLLSLIIEWTEHSGAIPIAAFAGGSWLGTYLTVRQT